MKWTFEKYVIDWKSFISFLFYAELQRQGSFLLGN